MMMGDLVLSCLHIIIHFDSFGFEYFCLQLFLGFRSTCTLYSNAANERSTRVQHIEICNMYYNRYFIFVSCTYRQWKFLTITCTHSPISGYESYSNDLVNLRTRNHLVHQVSNESFIVDVLVFFFFLVCRNMNV